MSICTCGHDSYWHYSHSDMPECKQCPCRKYVDGSHPAIAEAEQLRARVAALEAALREIAKGRDDTVGRLQIIAEQALAGAKGTK